MVDAPLPATVAGALAAARALGVERLDAQLLLARALGRPRAWLIAHGEATLTDAQWRTFDGWCRRRADGEPAAYLLGEREFHGLMLEVSPAVLVPRPDTETLVDWALELLRGPLRAPSRPTVADLGTGSGAIALAVKAGALHAQVVAVDRSVEALAVARRNAHRLGLDVELLCGDWWQPLAGRRCDLLLSNPPYVAADDPHLAALRHEPAQALTPGADPLAALALLASGAPRHLLPGGWLLLEHGQDQADAVQRLLRQAGLVEVVTRTDLEARPRCTGGRLPADGASASAGSGVREAD